MFIPTAFNKRLKSLLCPAFFSKVHKTDKKYFKYNNKFLFTNSYPLKDNEHYNKILIKPTEVNSDGYFIIPKNSMIVLESDINKKFLINYLYYYLNHLFVTDYKVRDYLLNSRS